MQQLQVLPCTPLGNTAHHAVIPVLQVGTYDYAGCLTLPRLLYLDYDRLWQEPVPELVSLRSGEAWHDSDLMLAPDQPVALPQVGGSFLDLEVTFKQGSATMVGLLLRSYNANGEGGAAVLYNWETQVLEVVFDALDPATMSFSLTAPTARHIGGQIDVKPGQPLQLRLLLDFSCLEVFTGTGEVLSTRVYRGHPPPESDSGIEFVALDGTATLTRVAAYEMRSIWKSEAAEVVSAEGLAMSGKPVSRTTSVLSEQGLANVTRELAGAAGGPGVPALEEPHQILPEEEMTADIFMEVLA